jgi:hypothetical protein
MKVILKNNGARKVYENCEIEIKENEIIVTRKFKDGDFIINREDGFMAIFKEKGAGGFLYDYAFLNFGEDVTISNIAFSGFLEDFQPATEEEKQMMHDALKKQGLQWNAEEKRVEKRVEKIRWRAKKGGDYHFLTSYLTTITTSEVGDYTDTSRYDALNYFRTKKQVEEAAKRVKETLRKYHEEIGE